MKHSAWLDMYVGCGTKRTTLKYTILLIKYI